MTQALPNRTYKDSLFRMIFSEKEELLNLYNAVNGSCYTDPEALEFNTIEDVLYLGIKNDVSFLIGSYLNLYEAQATWNPNMPLRGLLYLAHIYQGYIAREQLDLYSGTLLKLPLPQYIVFYNGTRKEPDRTELRLSDAFLTPPSGAAGSPCLDCRAVVLNINYGHNQELMNGCRKLYEYAYLVAQVRAYLQQGLTLKGAIDKAVEHCIEHGIMREFLLKHQGEVTEVILTGYDTEIHIRTEYKRGVAKGLEEGLEKGREEGLEEGREKGLEEGENLFAALTAKLIQESRMDDLQKAARDKEFRDRLYYEYGIRKV